MTEKVGAPVFAVVFFAVVNGGLGLYGVRRAQRAAGVFKALVWVPLLPMAWLVASMCHDWFYDETAANLWPIGMALMALPCAILEGVVRGAQRLVARRQAMNPPPSTRVPS